MLILLNLLEWKDENIFYVPFIIFLKLNKYFTAIFKISFYQNMIFNLKYCDKFIIIP